MTAKQLYDLLVEVPDTREIVIRPVPGAEDGDELAVAWRVAREEAERALAAWRAVPGRNSFSVYRAAEDRADAAQDALAGSGLRDHGRSAD